MAKKKGGLNCPATFGSKGIPPGVGARFPKGKRSGVEVPSEMGDQGKPKSSYPGSRSVPVIFGGD